MSELGFAIVGCGTISEFHAKAIKSVPNARLIGLYSRNRENAERLANSIDDVVYIYSDFDEMLQNDDIHVICICTPSGAHLEPAILAANAGKHIIVEKPLEITLKRCDEMIEICKKNDVQLGAIFPSRFTDVNIELKKAIKAKRFGKIVLADTTVKWWRSQEYYDSGGWRGTWDLDGGGALMNQAIHNVDLLQYMAGPIAEISAYTDCLAHDRIEVEDTAVASVRFDSGALGTITATTSAFPGLLKTIAIHGNKGSVVIEQDNLLTWQFEDETEEDEAIRQRFSRKSDSTGGASDPKAISYEYHARQIDEFVQSIFNGFKPSVDGAEARKAVEIILGIYESQFTDQKVKLPLAQDPDLPKLRKS